MVVATELGGVEALARERVDDVEPQWPLVCMEGEIVLPVKAADPLVSGER